MIYQVANFLLTKKKRFKTLMLRSDLCSYSDVYIIMTGDNDAKTRNKKLV